jgi:uncharacterized RDD family membrane protein YckC
MKLIDDKNQEINDFRENSNNFGNMSKATPGDRLVAFLLDMLIAIIVGLIPVIGNILGVAYILLRDSIPFLDGQSIGKKVLKLQVIDLETHTTINNRYDKSVIRNVSLFLPIFNIVDAAWLLFSDEKNRFGDKWAHTTVVHLQD